ncbi:hypothetical protein AK830_g6002 [Neonectria ditissima]|uniref:J domain-containing protein n=1 Tax=Neonectria ditissima TaxID=78410 RepID=A0A0P7AS11_9HYPO|nr:hypothetical protein AK830_g6002 [Neonectria ditissima]
MVAIPSTVDHYAVLQVSPTADEATIKSAYRRLARLKHPDKNTDTPDATAEFQQLTTAYTVLTNKKTRRKFDLRYTSIRRTKSVDSLVDPPPSQNNIGNKSSPHAASARRSPSQPDKIHVQEKEIEEVDPELRRMEAKKRKLQRAHSDATREVDMKQSAIDSLEADHEQQIDRENAAGDISALSEKDKAERTRRETRRRVDRMVVDMELRRCKVSLRNIAWELHTVDKDIQKKRY